MQSTLHNVDSQQRQSDGRMTLGASYPVWEKWRTSASIVGIQDFAQSKKASFGNARVAVSRSAYRLTEDTVFIPAIGLRLPTNVDDRKSKTYNGSGGIRPLLLTNWSIAGSPLATILSVEAIKNHHTYNRAASGDANLDHQITTYLGVEKPLGGGFSFLLDGDYTYAQTYEKSMRTLFSMGQSVTYEHKQISITIGHSNDGDALMANGRDYNVQVFDQNTSVVYVNTRFVY